MLLPMLLPVLLLVQLHDMLLPVLLPVLLLMLLRDMLLPVLLPMPQRATNVTTCATVCVPCGRVW